MKNDLFFKKFLSLSLAFSIVFSNGISQNGFSYADNKHWANDVIEEWKAKKYLQGDKDGNVFPDKNLSRAEFAAMMNRVNGYTEKTEKIKEYKDVKESDWYYNDFSIAIKKGYISGTSKDTVSPKKELTRQEAIAIIDRIANQNSKFNLKDVKDKMDIAPWAIKSMQNMIGNGFVTGYEGKVNPKKVMTKAEAIILLNSYKEDNRTLYFKGTYNLGNVNKITVLSPDIKIVDTKAKEIVIAKDVKGKVELVNTETLSIKNESKDAKVMKDDKEVVIKDNKIVVDKKEKQIKDQEYKDGTYEGKARGYKSYVKVKVTVKEGKITNIDVVEQNEDAIYWTPALKTIEKIISHQKTDVDVVTGATISSKAIIYAVKNTLSGATTNKSKETLQGKFKDGEWIGEANGYNGLIQVKVTIKNNEMISIEMISNSDDSGYIEPAMNLFDEMVRGQTTSVDAVSGATYSSNGIINAVKDALEQARGNTDKPGKSKYSQESSQSNNGSPSLRPIGPKEEKDFSDLKDGVYRATSDGYHSNSITVEVTVENKKIKSIKVIENKDDKGYFSDENAQKLANSIAEKQSTKVDVVSGATTSSHGLISAVVKALQDALPENAKMADRYLYMPQNLYVHVDDTISEEKLINLFRDLPAETKVELITKVDTSAIKTFDDVKIKATFKDNSTKEYTIKVFVRDKSFGTFNFLPVEEIKKLDEKIVYKDGTYYGDAFGHTYAKPVSVKVTIENGKIKNISPEINEIGRVYGEYKIDDGDKYAAVFDKVAHSIIEKQNPMAFEYKLKSVRDASIAIMKDVQEKTAKGYNDSIDKALGVVANRKRLDEGEVSDRKRENIRRVVQDFAKKELNYGEYPYDVVSGATYTATGTAGAVRNALEKMGKTYVDMRVDDNSYKRDYLENQKLDLSTLKVTLYDKDRKATEVTYDKFKDYNIKVYIRKVLSTEDREELSEVKNDLVLTEQNLGHRIGEGIELKVVHEDSKTMKLLKTILIKPDLISLKDKDIQFSTDGNKWYSSIGHNTKEDFKNNLYFEKSAYDVLSKSNDIKIRRIVKVGDTSEEKTFNLINVKKNYQDGKIYYSADVNKSDIMDAAGKKLIYNLPAHAIRLFIHPYNGTITVGKTLAEHYNVPAEISAAQGTNMDKKTGNISEKFVRESLNIPFVDTKITILSKVTTDEVKEQDLKIKLDFTDKSSKEYTTKLKVRQENQADKFEKDLSHYFVSISLKSTKDKFKDLKIVKDDTLTKEKVLKELKDIKSSNTEIKSNNYEIQSIEEITTQPKRENISKNSANEIIPDTNNKARIKIKFNDNSEKTYSINTKVTPIPMVSFTVDDSGMTKSYGIGEEIDFSKLKAKVKFPTKLENGEWTEENPEEIEVPFEDFEEIGLKIGDEAGENEYSIVGNKIIIKEEMTINDGDKKVSLSVFTNENLIDEDEDACQKLEDYKIDKSKKTTKADNFKKEFPKLNEINTMVSSTELDSLATDINNKNLSLLIEAGKITDKSLMRDLKLDENSIKTKYGKITISLENKDSIDLSDWGSTDDGKIKLKFDDNSEAEYSVKINIRPIPIAKFMSKANIYKNKGTYKTKYKLGETIDFSGFQLPQVTLYKVKEGIGSAHHDVLAYYGDSLTFKPIKYEHLKYFGLKIFEKDTENEITNGMDVSKAFGTKIKLDLELRYVIEKDSSPFTADENVVYNFDKNPNIFGNKEKQDMKAITLDNSVSTSSFTSVNSKTEKANPSSLDKSAKAIENNEKITKNQENENTVIPKIESEENKKDNNKVSNSSEKGILSEEDKKSSKAEKKENGDTDSKDLLTSKESVIVPDNKNVIDDTRKNDKDKN